MDLSAFEVAARRAEPDDLASHVARARQIASAMARRRRWCRDPEALYGAALLGLADALRRSPAEMSGPQFRKYSGLRMVGAVLDELRKQDLCSRRGRELERRVRSGQPADAVGKRGDYVLQQLQGREVFCDSVHVEKELADLHDVTKALEHRDF